MCISTRIRVLSISQQAGGLDSNSLFFSLGKGKGKGGGVVGVGVVIVVVVVVIIVVVVLLVVVVAVAIAAGAAAWLRGRRPSLLPDSVLFEETNKTTTTNGLVAPKPLSSFGQRLGGGRGGRKED